MLKMTAIIMINW